VRSLDETLNGLQEELRSVEAQLSEPDVASDLTRLRDLSRRHKELSGINVAWIDVKSARDDLATAKEMFDETEGADRESWRDEVNSAEERLGEFEARLETLLLPHDPNEGRNVILEIRGAEGGEEANLFASDLATMYRRYAAIRGWKLEVIEERDRKQAGERQFQQQAGKAHHQHAGEGGAGGSGGYIHIRRCGNGFAHVGK